MNLAPDSYIVVVFGIINPSKSPSSILNAARSLCTAGIPIKVVFIGRESASFELSPEVEQRGLHDAVVHLGFIDDLKTVNLWLSAADVAIGLRSTYWGETPSSALRMLAGGLPLITHGVGAFAELPDAACIKLAPTNSLLSEALCDALTDLYRQPERRQAMGSAARQYIADIHDPNIAATHYVTAAQTILGAGYPADEDPSVPLQRS
jgi:glycosyltransferase involved in cell wall biosynthesis